MDPVTYFGGAGVLFIGIVAALILRMRLLNAEIKRTEKELVTSINKIGEDAVPKGIVDLLSPGAQEALKNYKETHGGGIL